MKNDQDGQMSFARHVYANPLNPEICPVLSLGVLLFTRGANLPGSPSLLFGYNAKERFSTWLRFAKAVSIWLRAGWSLGSVQGQYIFEGSGGDQFVGRAAT
ncbi:hypothetical protein AaE_007736, partial [Aphanomyces astaci]